MRSRQYCKQGCTHLKLNAMQVETLKHMYYLAAIKSAGSSRPCDWELVHHRKALLSSLVHIMHMSLCTDT